MGRSVLGVGNLHTFGSLESTQVRPPFGAINCTIIVPSGVVQFVITQRKKIYIKSLHLEIFEAYSFVVNIFYLMLNRNKLSCQAFQSNGLCLFP